MAAKFLVLDPHLCFYVIPFTETKSKIVTCGFTLYHDQNIRDYTSPAFEVPGTNLTIKVRLLSSINSSQYGGGIQILLVEPEDDIITTTVGGYSAKLTSGLGSYLYFVDSPETWKNAGKPDALKYTIKLGTFPSWRPEYKSLKTDEANDVVLKTRDGDQGTRKTLLEAHSDVFKAMFEHDTKEKRSGVVEIVDFTLPVVREMVRFMMHGYCCLWFKEYEALTAIADKYNIVGMKALAVQKKKLLDSLA